MVEIFNKNDFKAWKIIFAERFGYYWTWLNGFDVFSGGFALKLKL